MQNTFPCHNCGTQNHIGRRFCGGCGQKLQYNCSHCGTIIDPSFESCPECHTALYWPSRLPVQSAPAEAESYQQQSFDEHKADRPEREKSSPWPIVFLGIVIVAMLIGGIFFAIKLLSEESATTTLPPAESTATLDNNTPVITDISVLKVDEISAVIAWHTAAPSTSQLEYGKNNEYGSTTKIDRQLVTEHSITIAGLDSATTYHFRVKSRDRSGNEASSEDNTFTTGALTELGGIISVDTTWKKEDSPFLVTDDVHVVVGAILTIEPGVIVKFKEHPSPPDAYNILVDGVLQAKGIENQQIIFTSSGTHHWGGIVFNGAGSEIEHCTIEYGGADREAPTGVRESILAIMNSAVSVKNCIVRYTAGDAFRITGDAEIVGNQVLGRIVVLEGAPHLAGNEISGDGIYIGENLISGNPPAPVIINNNIKCSNTGTYEAGVIIYTGSPAITYNNIVGSSSNGIVITYGESCNPIIEHNNIYNNRGFALLLHDTDDTYSFPDNWWGTTNTSEIDTAIYDNKDEPALGTVNYKPVATSVISNAGIQ